MWEPRQAIDRASECLVDVLELVPTEAKRSERLGVWIVTCEVAGRPEGPAEAGKLVVTDDGGVHDHRPPT